MTQVQQALGRQRSTWVEISKAALKLRREFRLDSDTRFEIFGLGSSFYASALAAAICEDSDHVFAFNARSARSRPAEVSIGVSHRLGKGATMERLAEGKIKIAVCAKDAARTQLPAQTHVLETVEVEKVEPHTISVTGAISAVTSFIGGEKMLELWRKHSSAADQDFRLPWAPSLVIGEGSCEILGREFALKLMEMAGMAPHVFGTEDFWHGPRFAFGPRLKSKAFLICGRDLDGRMNDVENHLRNSGAEIEKLEISPGGLGIVEALVSLHGAALKLALAHGKNPDIAGG